MFNHPIFFKMAKNSLIWIIVVILALIFIVPNSKHSYNLAMSSTQELSDCNNYKIQYINEGAKCVTDCIQTTQEIKECAGDYFKSITIGRYTTLADYDEDCNSLTGAGKTYYDCTNNPTIGCQGQSTSDCIIDGCQGNMNRVCINNEWTTWSICLKNDDNCGISTCSDTSTQSCTIGTCAGTQTRTCNSGTWSAWGTCTKNDANCVATTQDCRFPEEGTYPNCKISTMVYVIGGILILFMFMMMMRKRR